MTDTTDTTDTTDKLSPLNAYVFSIVGPPPIAITPEEEQSATFQAAYEEWRQRAEPIASKWLHEHGAEQEQSFQEEREEQDTLGALLREHGLLYFPLHNYEDHYWGDTNGAIYSLKRQRTMSYHYNNAHQLSVGLTAGGNTTIHRVSEILLTTLQGAKPNRNFTPNFRDGNVTNLKAQNLYWWLRKRHFPHELFREINNYVADGVPLGEIIGQNPELNLSRRAVLLEECFRTYYDSMGDDLESLLSKVTYIPKYPPITTALYKSVATGNSRDKVYTPQVQQSQQSQQAQQGVSVGQRAAAAENRHINEAVSTAASTRTLEVRLIEGGKVIRIDVYPDIREVIYDQGNEYLYQVIKGEEITR